MNNQNETNHNVTSNQVPFQPMDPFGTSPSTPTVESQVPTSVVEPQVSTLPVQQVPEQPVPPVGQPIPVQPVPPVGQPIPVQPVPPVGQPVPVQPVPPVGQPVPVQPVPPVGQPVPVQPVPPVGQPIPVQPVPPVGQPTPVQPPVTSEKDSSSKKTVALIIGVIALVVICIVLGIVLWSKNNKTDSKISNTNTYEETSNSNSTSTSNSNTTSNSNSNSSTDDTYTFMGVEFKKVSGYTYEEDSEEGTLSVYNDKWYTQFDILEYKFSDIKTDSSLASIKSNLTSSGFTVGDMTVSTISGIEIIYASLENSSGGFLYYILSVDDSHILEGITTNSNLKVDYTDLNNVITITSGMQYVGNFTAYSNQFSISPKNVF